ncbi:MAG: SIS domain-containing protein [Syntrophobacteria bacterium]
MEDLVSFGGSEMFRREYIFQEISEQEKIAALHRRLPGPKWPRAGGKMLITGAGDSYCGALFGHWLLQNRFQATCLPALEASSAAQHFGPEDILVCISVSGYTSRVIEAAKRVLAVGAQVVAVTDNLQSPLAELTPVVWPIYASPPESLTHTSYQDEEAKQYVGYHHDVAQTKTFWAVLLTLIRAAQVKVDWQLLLTTTRQLLGAPFYEPLMATGSFWAQSGQTFFLGSGWAKIAARFAAYKMYEFNRLAHFTDIEEYCHTRYFITRTGDTIVFLITDRDAAARAVEIVPLLQEFFAARIIWLQPEFLGQASLPHDCRASPQVITLPAAGQPVLQFLNLILAMEWITYCIGRVGAPDINTFHAGYDTERLVAGTLRTIRRSALRL